MKTDNRVFPVVTLLGMMGIVMLSPSARADDGGPFSIGVRAMSFMPKDGDASWNGGIQARLGLPLMFAAELSVDHRQFDVGNRTVEDYPVQLTALIYVLPKIIFVQPYILGGGGWYNSKLETPGAPDDTKSRFAPHAGAGLDFSLGSKWFLDATYRYVFLSEIANVDDSGSMVTLGVNYRF